MKRSLATLDANEAVALVAYRLNEVIAIYPITPSSVMGEWADQWASEGLPNIWGTVPTVVEMQSEGGAAGAVHGALQTGSLATTFTASQGLMLMLPNMYKIAGELTPAVFHVAARSLAAQALSIFGDHGDVMAARPTGFGMLCSSSVQEAQDFALIAQAASLEARIPFIHFFDGFRTSHEVAKIELLDESDLRAMINDEHVMAHKARALSPDNPFIRGTAQNPDTYFQGRETVNSYYLKCPAIVQNAMDRFAGLTGRQYKLFDYYGAPDARRVIVIMGSGAEAVHETVDYLNAHGERVAVLKVRLFRPFDARSFAEALPSTVQAVAVMDRTKEPGSLGEPLYMDCLGALYEFGIRNAECGMTSEGDSFRIPHSTFRIPTAVGGRYGLSSKEFTPAMIKAIFDNLAEPQPRNHFTVGINDDVTYTSLDYDPDFVIEPDDVFRGLFYGLGSDGTVGANKSSIKIIGEETNNYAQGYFVYDSKKSGAITVSHLRFGPRPIHSTYLIQHPNFVACHQPVFLDRYDMLNTITPGGVFLLNSHYWPNEIWAHLPDKVQEQIREKNLSFYIIDANKVGRDSGMRQINTIMQVCFFAISGVLPRDEAMAAIEHSIRKTYGKKGDEVVRKNLEAISRTLEHLHKVEVPRAGDRHPTTGDRLVRNPQSDAPTFVREVLGKMIIGEGDSIPVSALPVDGTYPSGTSQYEKRNLANEIPVWDENICIQCGKCAMVCPHGVIRIKVFDEAELASAPPTFKHTSARDREWQGMAYSIQVSPEDCTSCGLCVDVCPVKNKSETRLKALNLQPQAPLREQENENWQYFLGLPEMDRLRIKESTIRQQQVQQPLFEFSLACSGCGETPYLKLLTQLFGDRLVVANATGCSSIYGGNMPVTPWTYNREGRGPAWSNSLFEDNAEFGLGFRVSLDKQSQIASDLLKKLASQVGQELAADILNADQHDEAGIHAQRERVAELKVRLTRMRNESASDAIPHSEFASDGTPYIPNSNDPSRLLQLADMLVRKSVWIVGGDGWAYDIGFGGLDHVLASGRNVKVLVMDTEVYSNTGGQMSKSTPRGAVAKFAAGGKPGRKKDLGLIAMTYGNIYVASVAMGAKDEHTLKAFLEAEAYDGPALIIAYSHCIAHGIDMTKGLQDQKAAVDSGQWLLYRYNPDLEEQGQNPLILDSRQPNIPLAQYMDMENRFKMLYKSHPEHARQLLAQAEDDVDHRRKFYEYMAGRPGRTRKENESKADEHEALSSNGRDSTG